jgi:uncharacterized membrane protein (UPF0136 family)
MSSEPPPPDERALVPAGAALLRRRWLLALSGALLALAGGPFLFLASHQSAPGLLAGLLAYFSGLYVANRSLANPAAFRVDPRPLRLDDQALWAGDERLVGREEVAQAFVSSNAKGGALLRLHTRRGARRSMPLTLALAREVDGEALMRALRLDASRSVASYQVGSRLMMHRRARNLGLALFAAGVLLAFGALSLDGAVSFLPAFIMGPFTIVATLLSMLGFSLALIWPSRILVGPDGVVIRWLGTSRRIPLGELESVAQEPGTLRLALRSGEVIELSYPGKAPSAEHLAAWQQQGITSGVAELGRAGARIEEALEAHRRGHAIAPELSLERGTRETREWLRQIRAVSGGAQAEKAGYRKQVVEPDKLWTLVENPSMTPTARVGAAVALAGTLDEAGRARLRIAAEASALPGVKGALGALARERAADEDELTALLEAAADDEDEQRSSPGRRARGLG